MNGEVKAAQQRSIQNSPVNQSQFADGENEHPPSQRGHTEQRGLRAAESETEEIHFPTEDPPLCFHFTRIAPIHAG